MNYILMAVPVFFLLILIELAWDTYKKTGTYRLNDAINSITMGTLSRITKLIYAIFPISFYLYFYEDFALISWSEDNLWVYLLAIVLYDISYYCDHRLGHTLNITWASHSIHHSSEDYNLSTALRQTSVPNILGWFFYIPLALLGFPPVVLAVAGAVSLIYQFWVHTQHIRRMPEWYETIFVTPSNHRVHHGKNKIYIDKNHGGIFILWDRLFGTFQEELENEKVIFGLSTQLSSWNPLWGNTMFLTSLIKDAWYTKNWFDKFTLWFRPTGYRPADVAERFPVYKSNEAVEKYDVTLSGPKKWYVFSQIIFNLSYVLAFLIMAQELNLTQLILGCSIITYSTFSLSKVQENKTGMLYWEAGKFIALSLLFSALIPMSSGIASAMISICIISWLALVFINKKSDENQHQTA